MKTSRDSRSQGLITECIAPALDGCVSAWDLTMREKENFMRSPVRCGPTEILQNTWNVIAIKVTDIQALALGNETIRSHDFQ